MSKMTLRLSLIAAAASFRYCAAEAADWPQFLGPNRDGVSSEKIAARFPTDGPRIVWKRTIGRGLAGPVVAEGKVILFHRQDGDAVIEALATADGKSLWRFTYRTNYRDDFGFDDGPRAPPTMAGGRLFAYGAEGNLHAVEATTGKLLWKHDLVAELASRKGWFGRCCAPLVAGKVVLVNVGGELDGKVAGIAAFDAESGKLAWTSSDDEASYSSPILTTIHDRTAAVFFTRKGLEVVDAARGTPLYKETFEPDISASVTACTPIACGPNRIFLSACYGVGACVWEFNPDLTARSRWRAMDKLDCHYGTPVFVGGHLYGFHGRQEYGQELRCIDAATGEVKWRSPELPAGSILAASDTLVVLTEKGESLLVAATPREFSVRARGQILGAVTRAFPALAGGILYARDDRQLVAVDLSPAR
jgi:outer membrane protein assembly factor BamB